MTTLDTRGSEVVGGSKLAKILGRSRDWARKQLRDWLAEQTQGGERRVFQRGTNPKPTDPIYTTMAIVRREFGLSDPRVDKRIKECERALEWQAKQIADLITKVTRLEKDL